MTQKISIHKQPILPVSQSINRAPKQGKTEKIPFQDILTSQLDQVDNQLKFSAHAKQRMVQSGLQFESSQLEKIARAVKAASQKGSKESLVLTDNAALVVSVKNNTVITVVESERMRENVFTNIDSAVIV
ncbi:TIGR02530 family flagellar biosynthesis protein [Desulfitibacter alkalitolerans]|uniref:TIGR02530 family flagellar biosynthesis protein n=1 Tax=Desulfitibacter alkalitolerans TaxID=264641 RepID=UPI000481641B|nr:TIGR02530 family flagellar biosynthesis protein [Desulfitibacter alkalitolerans]